MKKKKILFAIESLSGGGAEKILTTIVKNLDKTKFDITVLVVVHTGVYLKEVSKYCKVKYILEDYSNIQSYIGKLKYRLEYKKIYSIPIDKVYRKYVLDKYDIEIAFVEGYATKLIAASTNHKSRKIAWVHTDLLKNSYADEIYTDQNEHLETYRQYNCIFCVSQNVKESFENKFHISTKAVVQYNPVDEEEIRKKSVQELDIVYPYQGLLLGTIGRLEYQKGYLRLLKCVKRLLEKGYQFTIWIIGLGSEKEKLEQYIKENNLNSAVILLGFKENPYQYLRYCDAFICSSYAEGFSTAATESIILGRPIFTVECSGMKELIGNSGCGEIVPNTNEELYNLLERLVSGEYNLEEYKKKAIKRSENFLLKTRICEIEEKFLDI